MEPNNNLPDKPLVSIRPSKSWSSGDISAIWEYRELLLFLTWRDVRVRYRQTVIGLLWVVIQPLFTMIIFALFFGRLVGVPSDGVPYPLFAFAGIVPWTFFSNTVNSSSNSLVGSSNLITKVYFPRLIIPGAAVMAGLVDFSVAMLVMGGLMVFYQVGPTMNILILPPLMILTALLALGVGMWMSALNVKYRDVRFALPFVLQLLMFATPIIYPSSIVPAPWSRLIFLNPLAGLIDAYRSAVLGRPFNWQSIGFTTVLTLGLLVWAAAYFRRTERHFADIV